MSFTLFIPFITAVAVHIFAKCFAILCRPGWDRRIGDEIMCMVVNRNGQCCNTDNMECSTRSRKLMYDRDGMPVQCQEWQLEYQQGMKTPDGD